MAWCVGVIDEAREGGKAETSLMMLGRSDKAVALLTRGAHCGKAGVA